MNQKLRFKSRLTNLNQKLNVQNEIKRLVDFSFEKIGEKN